MTEPFFRARPSGPAMRWSWEPGPALARAGWPTVPLGSSKTTTAGDAEAVARRINAQVAEWRAGRLRSIPDVIVELRCRAAVPLAPANAPPGTVSHLVTRYMASPEFDALAHATKRSYCQNLDLIREWGGDLPVGRITPKDAKHYYQTLAKATPARAGAMVVMGRVLWSWGRSELLVTGGDNPWRLVKVRTARRAIPILWSPVTVDLFVRVADRLGQHGVGTAVLLNSWLGQRRADVLQWSHRLYQDGRLSLTQQKTGATVSLPLAMVGLLAARLAADANRAQARGIRSEWLIYQPLTGQPYTGDQFRAAFDAVRAAAVAGLPADPARQLPAIPPCPAMADLDMMRLRHTAVTQLADAGCSTLLIRSITGHSLQSVDQIIQRYGVITPKQADRAFRMRMSAEGMAPADDPDSGAGDGVDDF